MLVLAALLVATCLVYWPGLTGGFVFDDYANIVNNTALRVSATSWRDWIAAALSSPARSLPRPLAMLSFAANYRFTGLDPVPMKLANLAIHLLNAFLVFGLTRRLIAESSRALPGERARAEWAALFSAGSWALHPINVMAVLFIVQRMESLSHTFVFAGLWFYVLGRIRQQRGENGWLRILTALVLFTSLGVLVKESAALLPLYAFCIEICILRFRTVDEKPDRRLLILFSLTLLLPAILAVAWLLPKALDPGAFNSRNFTLVERLMTEPRVIFDYLRWSVAPDLAQLSLYHDDYVVSRGLLSPPSTIVGLIGLPALLGLALWLRNLRPLASLGLLWFLGAHAITGTIVPLELVFEHRNYFASLGISLLLADLLFLLPFTAAGRRICAVLALASLFALAGITYLRCSEWSSPVSLAVAEAAKHPTSPRATYYLGWMLASASGYQSDSPLIAPAFAALQKARQLPDSNILPDQAALVLAARTGMPVRREWWDHMQKRLRAHPIGPQETGALGGLMTCALERHCAFEPDDMLATFGAALSQGANPEVLSIYANYALNVLEDPALALRLWSEAMNLSPDEPQYRISVIKLLIHAGRYDGARIEISRLRHLGRFDQYARVADELSNRLRDVSARLRVRPAP